MSNINYTLIPLTTNIFSSCVGITLFYKDFEIFRDFSSCILNSLVKAYRVVYTVLADFAASIQQRWGLDGAAPLPTT